MAQTPLPDKGLRIIVGFVNYGGADRMARSIAAELERRIGRRIGIENRPGDAGARPGYTLLRQPPDGTVLALFASSTFVASLADADFRFDPVADLPRRHLAGRIGGLAQTRRRDLRRLSSLAEVGGSPQQLAERPQSHLAQWETRMISVGITPVR